MKPKIIRTSTVAMSLDFLLKGQLDFLNKEYEVVAVSGQDEHLEEVRIREGVRTVAVPMQRQISPLKDVVSLWKLFWLFRKEKPQIVHSITPKAGLLSMTAAYFAGVPIRMHTFTGLVFPSKTGILQQILILMDKILCRFATNIYPEGQGVRGDLIQFKITKKALKVLANGNVNGIDIGYFSPKTISDKQKTLLRTELKIQPGDFVFIFVGRLVTDKGINELVAAFAQLTTHNSQLTTYKLLLIGPFEEDLDPLFPETIQEIQHNKNIISVGFQKDVRPYFTISNVLVFPSYREGFPNVVMQAGAMGLPSIVSDISGCNEIIVENQNGIIVPIKEEKAIYKAMQQLVEDSILRNQLQQNARAMIISRYEQQLVWEAILKEYRLLIKKS